MWLANFEDGSSVTSKQTFWTQLPKDKKLSGVQLSHPHLPKLFISLSGMDLYYFATEAICPLTDNGAATVVAEVIGGHDLEHGVATEIRLNYNGAVRVKTYPIESYKYSKDILIPGVKREPSIAKE